MQKSWIYFNLCFLLLFSCLSAKSLSTLELKKLKESDRQKLIDKYIKLNSRNRAKVNLRFYELYSDCDSDRTLETAVMMDEFYEKFSKNYKKQISFNFKLVNYDSH